MGAASQQQAVQVPCAFCAILVTQRSWVQFPNSIEPEYSSIYGRRISPEGTLLDAIASAPGTRINTSKVRKEWAALAFDSANYVAVWNVVTAPPHSNPGMGLYAAWVTPAGRLVNTTVSSPGLLISEPVLSPWTRSPKTLHPTMKSGDGSILLVWFDTATSSIRGSLIYPFE